MIFDWKFANFHDFYSIPAKLAEFLPVGGPIYNTKVHLPRYSVYYFHIIFQFVTNMLIITTVIIREAFKNKNNETMEFSICWFPPPQHMENLS